MSLTRQQVREMNRRGLGLTNAQMDLYEKYMADPKSRPESLKSYLRVVCGRYGACGEVISDSIAEWLKNGSGARI